MATLGDEKDRVTHAKVEIEYLKQELEQFRQQVIDRSANIDVPNQPVSQSEAHTLRKELPNNTIDLFSTMEKSLIPVAAQIREKSIQVEMETMPNLPRIYGEGILLREAIESIFELLIVSAPRNSKLHIIAEPMEGQVHLQFSIQSMKLRFDEFLQEAQEKIQAFGGSMRNWYKTLQMIRIQKMFWISLCQSRKQMNHYLLPVEIYSIQFGYRMDICLSLRPRSMIRDKLFRIYIISQ